MALQDEIDQKRREIRTDGYSMSIGEWISLYENNELDIHPEFQRFYRWSEIQKTSLVESILLGIPIPPIFVSQRKDGVWDVVDGLQRLSTIFQLLGILKDEKGKLIEPLILQATKYLPSLAGMRWHDAKFPKNTLSSDAQLSFKRSKIAVSIILRESDENAKYDLFQRLNTGGSKLSPQEVRNCLLVMLNKKMYEWLQKLSQHDSFKEVCALSDRPIEESYDIELVLRFMVLYNIPEAEIDSVGDVGAYLTDKMILLANDKKFSYQLNEKAFIETFDLLSVTVGDGAFKRFNISKKRHEGGFLLSQFEVIALGVAFNLRSNVPITKVRLPKKIESIWTNPEYTSWAGSGITAARRLPRLLPLGRKLFAK